MAKLSKRQMRAWGLTEEDLEKPVIARTRCLQCNKRFRKAQLHPRRLYCSTPCRDKHFHKRQHRRMGQWMLESGVDPTIVAQRTGYMKPAGFTQLKRETIECEKKQNHHNWLVKRCMELGASETDAWSMISCGDDVAEDYINRQAAEEELKALLDS